MKRKLSVLDFDQELEEAARGGKESFVIKKFRKIAKKVARKLAKLEKKEKKKIYVISGDQADDYGDPDATSEADEVDRLRAEALYKRLKAQSQNKTLKEEGRYDPDLKDDDFSRSHPRKRRRQSSVAQSEGEERERNKDAAREDEILAELDREDMKLEEKDYNQTDLPVSKSIEAFEKILEALEPILSRRESGITDEELDQMMRLWGEYRAKAVRGVQRPSWLTKLFRNLCSRHIKRVKEKVKRKKEKKHPSKPCTCPVLEGGGVIIVKNVCECAQSCKRSGVTVQNDSQSAGDKGQVTLLDSGTNPSAPTVSSSITGKIVDSLEIIKKRVTPRSSRASRGSVATPKSLRLNDPSKTGSAEPSKTDPKSPDTEIKDLYRSPGGFTSATSIDVTGDFKAEGLAPTAEELTPVSSEPSETKGGASKTAEGSGKTSAKGESDEGKQDDSITSVDVQKLKSKKSGSRPPQDDLVISKPRTKRVQGEVGAAESESQEFLGVREAKELSDKALISAGRRRSTRPPKESEDAGELQETPTMPRPILGKGKNKKDRLDAGHVRFESQTTTNTASKHGERKKKKKMKTVMSVVSIVRSRVNF